MVDRVCNEWTHVKQSLRCVVRSTVAQRLASRSEEVYPRVEMMVVVRPLGCYSGGSHKIQVQALLLNAGLSIVMTLLVDEQFSTRSLIYLNNAPADSYIKNINK